MKKVLFTDCVDIVGESCKAFDGVKKYVSTGAVDVDHIDENDVKWVDYKGKPSRADLVVQPGDVLFAKMQGTEKTLQIDDTNADSIYSTGFFALRPKPGILTQRCLYYLLRSQAFLSLKDKNCSGATQKAITNTGLKKIFVSIPDYHEQDSVTAQLDLLSTIIKLRQMELQKLDELVKSQFIEMFGNGQYPLKRLDEVSTISSGLTKNSKRASMPIKMQYLRVANVLFNELDLSDIQEIGVEEKEIAKTLLQKDDLLFVEGNGSPDQIGRVSLWDGSISPILHQNHLIKARFGDEVLPEYAMYYFMSDEGREQILFHASTTSGLYTLSTGKISSFIIPVPPKQLQQDFITLEQQSAKSKFVIKQAFDKAQMLFDSLMCKYFGEV